MEALGRLFDIGAGVAPLDFQTARTGVRTSLRKAQGCTIVVLKGIGTAADDPTFTLKEHNASTGGTSQNLAAIDHYYLKTSTSALDGTQTWSRVTQAVAATVADPGGAGTSAESAQILVIEVDGADLSDGFTHISLDVADVGTNAQLGAVLYLVHDLTAQRKPANLPAMLTA